MSAAVHAGALTLAVLLGAALALAAVAAGFGRSDDRDREREQLAELARSLFPGRHEQLVPGLPRQFLRLDVEQFASGYDIETVQNLTVVEPGDATLVSSKLAGGRWHAPLLDIDAPVHVLPSSTPGHHHLLIDVPMTWRSYKRLLRALCKAGVVDRAYVQMALLNGATHVRKPGVTKPGADRSLARHA